MANGIIKLTSTSDKLEGRILWESTANVAEIKSNVKFTVQMRRKTAQTWGTWKLDYEFAATNNDSLTNNWTKLVDKTESRHMTVGTSWVTTDTFNLSVKHNQNGAQTIGIYVTITAPTGTSLEGHKLTSIGVTSGYMLALETIPVKIQITAAPNFTDEDNPTIHYSNIVHDDVIRVQACIADKTGTNIIVPYRNIDFTDTSYKFNFTEAERSALRAFFTDTTTTKKVKFYIKSEFSGQDPKYSNLERELTLINYEPLISVTITDNYPSSSMLTGNNQTFIRYASFAQIKITGVGRKGASIVSYSATNGSNTISNTTGTIQMHSVTHDVFEITIKDSRGHTKTIERKINLLPYFKVSSDLTAQAASAEGLVKCNISGRFWNGNFGIADNKLTLKYRYQKNGGEFSAWQTFTEPEVTYDTFYSTYTAEPEFTIADFDYKSAYIVQVRAEDMIGNGQSNEYSIKFLPIFDWGENDFNFNVPVKFSEGVTDGRKTYNLIGLAKAMSQRYSLPCVVTPRNGYSSASAQLYLYGNTIRAYIRVKRSAALAPNTLTSAEPVCSVEFDSSGKVIGFGEVGFSSGLIGNVATFQMTEGYIYPDDGSVSEESVGKCTFVIRLCNTAVTDDEWSAMFTFPCLIDLDKY